MAHLLGRPSVPINLWGFMVFNLFHIRGIFHSTVFVAHVLSCSVFPSYDPGHVHTAVLPLAPPNKQTSFSLQTPSGARIQIRHQPNDRCWSQVKSDPRSAHLPLEGISGKLRSTTHISEGSQQDGSATPKLSHLKYQLGAFFGSDWQFLGRCYSQTHLPQTSISLP